MRSRWVGRVAAMALVVGTGVSGVVLSQTPAHAAPSSAGTLLFIKNHNLWMARGDGSDAVQLTVDGSESAPYSSPSMADNGRIAVAQGSTFGVFEPTGALVASWTADELFLPNKPGVKPAPFDPEISPDGTKIAYRQVRTYTEGGRFITEGLTGVSPVGGGSFLTDIRIGHSPEWLTNDRFMYSTGDIKIANLAEGPGQDHAWFTGDDFLDLGDFDYVELTEPQLSPDGTTILTLDNGYEMFWNTLDSDPRASNPAAPTTILCRAQEEGAVPEGFLNHYDAVDYGPENDMAVYEQYGNLFQVENISACGASTAFTQIVAGGTDPDWSPVAYNPPTGGTNPPGTQPPGTNPPGTQPPGTQPPGAEPEESGTKKITLKKRVKLKGTAKVGRTLKAKVGKTKPRKAKKKYTWLRNGKKIKGAKKAKLRLTRADRGKKIQVKVVIKAKGYGKVVSKSKAVKVKR